MATMAKKGGPLEPSKLQKEAVPSAEAYCSHQQHQIQTTWAPQKKHGGENDLQDQELSLVVKASYSRKDTGFGHGMGTRTLHRQASLHHIHVSFGQGSLVLWRCNLAGHVSACKLLRTVRSDLLLGVLAGEVVMPEDGCS